MITLLLFVHAKHKYMGAVLRAHPLRGESHIQRNVAQSVTRKVNESGMKEDYEKNNRLRLALRCLPALAVVPSPDVTEAFLILTDNMPGHEKMPELLAYFEHTYIRGKQRAARGERYGSAIFPTESSEETTSSKEEGGTNSHHRRAKGQTAVGVVKIFFDSSG